MKRKKTGQWGTTSFHGPLLTLASLLRWEPSWLLACPLNPLKLERPGMDRKWWKAIRLWEMWWWFSGNRNHVSHHSAYCDTERNMQAAWQDCSPARLTVTWNDMTPWGSCFPLTQHEPWSLLIYRWSIPSEFQAFPGYHPGSIAFWMKVDPKMNFEIKWKRSITFHTVTQQYPFDVSW